jgi:hypothetical protein
MSDLLAELVELECLRCHHGYPSHQDGGGHCRGVIGGWSSPAAGIPCMCPGMRWVPAEVPEPPSYDAPPAPSAP